MDERIYGRTKLLPGQSYCDLCNGYGIIECADSGMKMYKLCHKCSARGVLDWVDVIIGKRPPSVISFK